MAAEIHSVSKQSKNQGNGMPNGVMANPSGFGVR